MFCDKKNAKCVMSTYLPPELAATSVSRLVNTASVGPYKQVFTGTVLFFTCDITSHEMIQANLNRLIAVKHEIITSGEVLFVLCNNPYTF